MAIFGLRFGFTIIAQRLSPKAGEFEVPARSSYADLFEIMDQGIPYQHRFMVIEGQRSQEIVVALNKDEG